MPNGRPERFVGLSRADADSAREGWARFAGCHGKTSRFIVTFLSLLLRERPAIVIFGETSLLPLALVVRCFLPATRTVLLVDEVRDEAKLRRTCRSRLFRAVLDTVLCKTAREASLVRDGIAPQAKPVKILALDSAPEATAVARDAREGDPRRLLCLAPLDGVDGLGELVSAIAGLRRSMPDIECDVIGEGRLAPELPAFVRALGLEKAVRFHGPSEGRGLSDVFREAGAVVIPSRLSGLRLAVREACRRRLPIICGRELEARGLVTDEVDAIVLDRTDSRALRAAVGRFVADPALAARLAERGAASLAARPSAFESALHDAFDSLAPLPPRPDVSPAAGRGTAQASRLRVLIYRLGSIGDMVVSLPSLHAIRRRYPGAEIALLTNQPADPKAASAGSVLQGSGLIDRFISYPLSTRHVRQLLAVRNAIRDAKPDVLFYLAEPRGILSLYRDFLFFKLCGLRRCIGFPLRSDLRSCRAPRAPGGRWEREAHRLARCLGPFGPEDAESLSEWDLGLSAEDIADALRLIARSLGAAAPGRRLMGLCVGTKQRVKDWGEENWRAVLRALRDPAVALVMIGAEDEWERSAAVAEGWPAPVLNFCGRLSPRMSAAVIRCTELFLCHDSGPMHLAAAQGVRCVAVFSGHQPPGKWFPIGDQHIVFYPPSPGDAIQAIQPAEVIEAARVALAEHQGRIAAAEAGR